MGTVLSRKVVMLGGRARKERPKTFKTEDSAKKYAQSNGIKDFELEDISLNPAKKKIRVISKK